MKKIILRSLALIWLPFAASALEVQHQDGIAYVTGGVGLEEREALKAMEKDYNLIVTLATKEGPYLSDTAIEITDNTGKTLLSANADGPFFYAKLPAGAYMVKVGSDPTLQSRKLAVREGETRRLSFYW